MTIIKVSESSGTALDWMVAKANGVSLVLAPFKGAKNFVILGQNMKPTSSTYEPSTNWAQGGPIIEREGLEVRKLREQGDNTWRSVSFCDVRKQYGPTPLIAAMRCFVASKLGDTVDVPEELLK